MVLTSASPSVPRTASADAFVDLCKWAADANKLPLPDHVRRRAVLVLIDDIGAAVAAAQEPEVAAAREFELAANRGAEATVLAAGAARIDRVGASLANGMASTWAELDEGYRLAPCHAGAYIWPALLAEAEAISATTGVMLRAFAVGYDITARLARAFPFATMTVHPHAAFATVGAAAGVALLRRLDGPALQSALSGAISMSFAGPYGHAIDGALVRNAWTAAGAFVGFRAVDWAKAGIGGIAETPFDVYCTCFGMTSRPEELNSRLGLDWSICDGYHKVFACCQYAHSMVEASLELHKRLGQGAGRHVVAIEVETHPRGMTLTTVEPPTVLSAKFSMPHAAAAVARRASGGKDAFTKDTLNDPAIAELRRKVKLIPLANVEPWPNDRAARVTWIMSDNSRHSADCRNARGGADQPFDEATLLDKLTGNTASVFPAMPDVLAGLLSPHSDELMWSSTIAAATGAKA
jgi:2-methylcitrate dehydratase PrpD